MGAYLGKKKQIPKPTAPVKTETPTEETGKPEETVDVPKPLWSMSTEELDEIGELLGIKRGKSKRPAYYKKLKNAWAKL